MADALAVAIKTLELKASCSHCGKECEELKRCSVCKHVSYCGAACQNVAWKKHKKTCVTLEEVDKRVDAAMEGEDWLGVIKWEKRLEQLLAGRCDATRESVLYNFKWAHSTGLHATGSTDHALAVVRLQDRRIELMGNMERFRDQGEAMCNAAEHLVVAEKRQEAAGYFQRGRDVGAAHGFFSVECKACLGLGKLAMTEGQHEEGVNLLRNALAASSLREEEDNTYMELHVLAPLADALFWIHEIDEVEPLVLRYREAAMVESHKRGRFCFWELQSLYYSARLLEVRGNPQEAEREVRALLDRMRENGASVQANLVQCLDLLQRASWNLNILDPELGEEELIKSAAAELAKVTAFIANNSERQQGPGGCLAGE